VSGTAPSLCARCVMDRSDPEIRFDAQGVCNHCRSYDAKVARLAAAGRLGPEHLDALLGRIREAGRGRAYDVVLGISGGADSSYLALLLRQWEVRTLLVHMDNGWDTPEALRNVRAVAAATRFDYESAVLDWEEFRDLQTAFLRASVVEAETPTDMAIASTLFATARRHGASLIASASNEASEGILPRLWHYDRTDARYLLAIQKRFGTLALERFPVFSLARELDYRLVRRIGTVYPLNYVDYDLRQARSRLERALGWRDYGGKHHENAYTKFVQAVLLPRKFGIDYRRATLSTLICSGRTTRDDALEQLQHPCIGAEEARHLCHYVAKKLRIGVDELEAILAAPAKRYDAYPNRERLRRTVHGAYRLLTKLREAHPHAGDSR